MNPENIKTSIQAVVDGLTPLAQKLQVPIEGIFRWTIKHNYAVGITEAVLPISFFIFFFLMVLKFYKTAKISEESCNAEGIIAIVCGICALVAMITMIGLLPNAIDRLVAPEWNASKDIYQLIKQ